MGGRRRTRRDDELSEVAAVDPVLHQELVELRRRSPVAFRKALARLVRQGVISSGRRTQVSPDLLALVRLPLGRVLAELSASERRGELNPSAIRGLLEEERRTRAREPLVAWLQQRLEEAL